MEIKVRKYRHEDIKPMLSIWNQVVRDGIAFPQEKELDYENGKSFLESQSYCGIAQDLNGNILGMYILHPNNVGRCSHIANASYAVDKNCRNQGIGEKLVLDSLEQAKNLNFKIMQFNAVVKDNLNARHLYERIGFKPLGEIPNGFRLNDGSYVDICPYYYVL